VSSTLNAFIAAGKINLDARELGNATHLLRRLWNHTFGDHGVARGGETAQSGNGAAAH
jgi:hypothetical protein